MPDFVLLWTDVLVYLLVGGIAAYVVYVRCHRHLSDRWQQVLRSRLGMAGAVVLCAYGAIGLLDSVHYLPSPSADTAVPAGVLSAFDALVGPLRTRVEKTYSAPLATHAYSRELVDTPDGLSYDYPRLVWGGVRLQDPQSERLPDLLRTMGLAIAQAALCWLALCVIVIGWQAARAGQAFRARLAAVLARETELPWDVALLTSGALLLLLFLCLHLSSGYHVLGTDKVGQDVLYQSLKSVRTGLVIGTLTTLFMLPFAIFLGVAAGYFRGWMDDAVQYLYATLASIPSVLLVAAAVPLAQVYMQANAESFSSLEQRADLRLLLLCLILGVTSWTTLCRLLRGETLKLREAEFVLAAQALGVGHVVILARHVLPNVMHIVLIALVLDFSGLVLAEAVLSYVNVGVDPTMHSWGNMINSARLELAREPIVWWSLAAAFLFMLGLVLAANLFADAVRDAFDPRLRRR